MMHSVESALQHLLNSVNRLPNTQEIPLITAHNRVLAESISSPIDVPPADNSSMDGYALNADDLFEARQILPVSQRIPAGKITEPLVPQTAARIFTGAEIPLGANAVVMQENCEALENSVRILKPPVHGENIRPMGQDIRAGTEVVRAGTRLRAQELGLLASVGIASVTVYRPLRVAVISTGEELVEPGATLTKGQIYNSNPIMLFALLEQLGTQPILYPRVPDTLNATKETLALAAQECDLILSSGGVSVGEEDYIKSAVSDLGRIDLWRIAIKPGKPLAFGHVAGIPFMGLPGNPASAFVTFLILARPWLLKHQGAFQKQPMAVKAPALFERQAGSRQEFLRARRCVEGIELYDNQSSGVLSSATWGDGLVIQYANQTIRHGQIVEFLPYTELG